MIQLLSASDSLELINRMEKNGIRVLGVEGFIVKPTGYMASLDLILDTSSLTALTALRVAREFIATNSSSNVLFEVCGDKDVDLKGLEVFRAAPPA